MKRAVELNRLLLKLLLCHLDIQESNSEDSATFNFLEITWESERSWIVHFSGFHRTLNSKSSLRWAPWCCLRDILASLKTSRFQLLWGWNV